MKQPPVALWFALLAALPGSPAPVDGPSPVRLHARFERAESNLRARLPDLLQPVRDLFVRARAGTPKFAAWTNSSWTGLGIACDAAIDWWAGPEAGETRVQRAIRRRFEQEVLSPAAVGVAIAQAAADVHAAIEAERVEAFLDLGIDSRDLEEHAVAHEQSGVRVAAGAGRLAGANSASALAYRLVDLGLDRLLTAVLGRLAARLGLRAGALGAGLASLGLSLVVTMVLEYAYDRHVEGKAAESLNQALAVAEEELVGELQTCFEASSRLRLDADVARLHPSVQ